MTSASPVSNRKDHWHGYRTLLSVITRIIGWPPAVSLRIIHAIRCVAYALARR